MSVGDNLEIADQAVAAGAVSRRLVLRRAVALGVSAPALLAVLQACGGDDEDENGNGGEVTDGDVTEEATEPAAETEPAETEAATVASPMASPMASPAASPMASPMASPPAGASPVTIRTTGDEATPES